MSWFSELASDAYAAYDQAAWGGLLPGGTPLGGGQIQGPLYNQTPVVIDQGSSGGVVAATNNPGVTRMAEGAYCGTGCDSPRFLTYDCKTGEFKKKRRRRRKAMLTKSDLGDLAFIATLPTNANVKQALAQRIARA